MKFSLRALSKFRVGLFVLGLLGIGTARAGGHTPPTAAAITAQTTAFFTKFVNKDGKVNYADIQRNPQPTDRTAG